MGGVGRYQLKFPRELLKRPGPPMSPEKVLWGRQSIKRWRLVTAMRLTSAQFMVCQAFVCCWYFSMFALFKNQCISTC